jgi:hypothetical protein
MKEKRPVARSGACLQPRGGLSQSLVDMSMRQRLVLLACEHASVPLVVLRETGGHIIPDLLILIAPIMSILGGLWRWC